MPARFDLHVVARLLGALARPGTTWSRSRLQAATRLNYDLFRRYLAMAIEKGWAIEDESGIRVTPAGEKAWTDLGAWLQRWFG
ncbi:MAG: hypothetical protein QOD77_783 [Thermoplasmata archaeon]|jgi:predicted transcriptional regulator|nr:hypothetical protein [Thermoplasmata archaeon]